MADTVNSMIEQIRGLHLDLAERFRLAAATAETERLRLVLSYLEARERHVDEALEHYQNSAPRAVLGTAFKTVQGAPFRQCVDMVRVDADDPDDMFNSVLEMDQCLSAKLRLVSEDALNDDVRGFFVELAEMIDREKKQTVRDAIEMEDL